MNDAPEPAIDLEAQADALGITLEQYAEKFSCDFELAREMLASMRGLTKLPPESEPA